VVIAIGRYIIPVNWYFTNLPLYVEKQRSGIQKYSYKFSGSAGSILVGNELGKGLSKKANEYLSRA